MLRKVGAMRGLWPALLVTLCGCPPPSVPPSSMQSAVRDRAAAPPGRPETSPKPTPSGPTDAPVATVNGRAVQRGTLVDLLYRSHGAGLLEQVVALEAAEQLVTSRRLSVSEVDVDREYVLALRRVADPSRPVPEEKLDRAAAERALDTALAERNISREEFFITLRRNAYLRKVVEAEHAVTDEELRAEYARRFGERVEVRHIQLATVADAERVSARLAAGEDFAELARRYSVNTASGRTGGLLDPFSADDEAVPSILRQTAFALEPGQVSGLVRAGEWHHLIRVERRIPAENRAFQNVIGELMTSVRERVSEPRMRELYERLLREAAVEIHDPVLREAYTRRRAGRQGAGAP